MKVIIQDLETQKFLAADESWTENIAAAKDFHFRPRAFDAVRLEHAHEVRVMYYFEDLDYAIGARNWQDHGWADLCAAA